MRKTKITEIIVEVDELISVNTKNKSLRAWCDVCGAELWVLSPETISSLYQLNPRLIYRLLETGHLHFTETPVGLPLICLNQLSAISEFADLVSRKAAVAADQFLLSRSCEPLALPQPKQIQIEDFNNETNGDVK
jgi:hypothetical protein